MRRSEGVVRLRKELKPGVRKRLHLARHGESRIRGLPFSYAGSSAGSERGLRFPGVYRAFDCTPPGACARRGQGGGAVLSSEGHGPAGALGRIVPESLHITSDVGTGRRRHRSRAAHNLDAKRVVAVVKMEPNFNPNAVSSRGEMEIIKLTPTTQCYIRRIIAFDNGGSSPDFDVAGVPREPVHLQCAEREVLYRSNYSAVGPWQAPKRFDSDGLTRTI